MCTFIYVTNKVPMSINIFSKHLGPDADKNPLFSIWKQYSMYMHFTKSNIPAVFLNSTLHSNIFTYIWPKLQGFSHKVK